MSDFDPIVTLEDALIAPMSLFKGNCHFYSFPLGVISIINFLTILLIIISIAIAFVKAVQGKGSFVTPVVIAFLGFITNIFMFYVQAYLIKGCQCAKSKKNNSV